MANTLSKIFERLLLNQFMDYLKQNSLLNVYQFGFKEIKSATDAVITLTEIVCENMDQSRRTNALFLDLAKALNSISLEIFLKKLKCMVFQKCIESPKRFFRDHQQCVKLRNHFSDWITLNHGVPQGTVLRTLVFIFHINDFKNQINRNMI